MSCENCGSAQLPGALYCIHCGHPFPGECPECGFANPPDARFCGGCRRSLSGGAVDTEGERRPLTFLFCDLVDSTALFEQLDPEDVRQVQNAVRRLFSRLAAMHDGYVAEYVGDGVVLYFGYPQAQENDPERAVRCGLAMARQVGSVRRTMRLSAPLAVRVAIHTDQATLGPVSPDDDRHWAAYGVATSITGRLQKNAPPGGVVVTDATWELTRGCFTGRSLGRVALDGVSQQITAWQVEGEVPEHDWDDERHTAALFVGREREQHLVDELWRAAIVGETHFALLRGEPGMGKSRLARHWCDVVAPTGANVVVARATSNGRNHPFHPIVALLEKTFGLGHGSTDERLSCLAAGLRAIGVDDAVAVPFLAPLLGVLPGEYSATADLSPARRRIRSIEVLTEVLAALCAEAPTLLIVEDLHWADESTVELLERVVRTFPALGLLGIFTSRPEFDGTWGRDSPLRTIHLDRLGDAEQAAIARAVAGGKALPGLALRQILARSEGVPLFVEELTRSMCESGMLQELSASWEIVAGRWADLIPMAVHAPLTARVDRLGAARSTAQIAATIGREFSVELLREVSGRDDVTLDAELRQLTEAGLIWRTADAGADTCVFKHSLLRDAAYELLSRHRRQAYHSRIAEALRGPLNHLALGRNDLIALHLTNAGEHDDAVAFWAAAGHDALLRTANLEAAGHFRRAIECLRELPETPERDVRELEMQRVLAPALFAVAGWASDETEQTCRRAYALAVELHRDDYRYAALWGLWSVQFLRGQLDEALPSAQAVKELADESGAPLYRVTAQHAISYTRLYRGEFEAALQEADTGLSLFDFHQEQELVFAFQLSSSVCLRQSRAQSLWMMGRTEESDEESARMVQLARDLGQRSSLAGALAFALHGGGMRYSFAGEIFRLRDIAEELRQVSNEEGLFMWFAVAEVYLGIIGQGSEEPGARQRILEGLELFAQTKTQVTAVMMKVIVAEQFLGISDDDEVTSLLDSAESDADTRRERFYLPELWRVRGRVSARRGDVPAAERAYRMALDIATEQKAHSLALRAALDMYDLLVTAGRGDEGRDLLSNTISNEDVAWASDRPEPMRARAVLAQPLIETGASYAG